MFKKNIFALIPIILVIYTSSIETEEDYEKVAEEYKNNYIKEFRSKVEKYFSGEKMEKMPLMNVLTHLLKQQNILLMEVFLN